MQISPPLKRKRGIATRDRILDISAGLFAQKGYDGVSLREIALAAGLKESSIYNHFSSKQEILHALFESFARLAPMARPGEDMLEKMLALMNPEEIFKNILFYVGSHLNDFLENISMILQNEKGKNAQAAKAYYTCLVEEPTEYYEKLIRKIADRGMGNAKNAHLLAQHYNYVSLALTQEYFMAKHGLGNEEEVVRRMIDALHFYCQLLRV